MSERLFEVITVHCFVSVCKHTVKDIDPQAAHDAMELHYRDNHRLLIDSCVARLAP